MFASNQQQQQLPTSNNVDTNTDGSPTSRRIHCDCCGDVFLIKWLEIICAAIIIVIVAQLICYKSPYFIAVTIISSIAIIVTVVTAVLYMFQCHKNGLHKLPWRTIELVINILIIILYLVGFGISVYFCIKWNSQNDKTALQTYDECGRLSVPKVLTETVLTAVCAILHLLSAMLARTSVLMAEVPD